MPFNHYKRMILKRLDKSKKGSWDERVLELCATINTHPNYVTLSSCSGRIMLLTQAENNRKDLTQWPFVTHELAIIADVKATLVNYTGNDTLFFRQEGPILHVCCKTLEDAQRLLDIAQTSGFKHAGIITTRKKIVVELISAEQLFCPIYAKKQLVSDEYLHFLIQEANRKLKKSWQALEKLSLSMRKLL